MILASFLFYCLLASALAAPNSNGNVKAAEPCTTDNCKAPDCRCSSTKIPGDLTPEQTPQFIMLTFDDAVQELNWQTYDDIFANRTNKDGCPVQATFFMSHEYSDYDRVHNLYVRNHEIALHSITHKALTDYWKGISVDDLVHEFGDERQLVAQFANIPIDALQGMRLPFLQLSGDNTFLAAKEIGLSYDCSWPTQTFRNPGLWPYTLDYKSTQDCPIGPCPTASVPGVWVIPMIDWTDQQNYVCSMVDACVNIPDNADDLAQWFIDNFNVEYNGNRAPFGFYVHNAYFQVNTIHLDAYKKFVDYLQSLDDVYLVSPTQVINWIKNPVALGSSEWPACREVEDLGCETQTCPVYKGDEIRYMTVCGDCPDVYPWLCNPLGEEDLEDACPDTTS